MEDAITASVGAVPQRQTALVNNELMNALVENSPEPMLLLEQDGSILYANKAMAELVGYRIDDLQLLGSGALFLADDETWRQAVVQGGQFIGELKMRHAQGFDFPVQWKTKNFTTSSGEVVTSAHVRDLRSYYQSQQQQNNLVNTLADLKLAVDHSADLICTFNLNGYLLQVNKACQTILGYAPEEMLGRHFEDFMHPDDVAITQQNSAKLQKNKVTINFNNRYLHKNGSVVFLSWSSTLLTHDQKAICTAQDITKLLSDELLRKQSEERLQALLNQGADMIGILSAKGDYIFASTNSKRLIGYSPEDFIGKSALDFIHPEDVEAVLQSLKEVMHTQVVQTKPFRFKNAPGQWRWLETTATNCLADPSINGIIINSRDVTERKLAEIRLQESEQRYKPLFHYNPDAVYSFDTIGYYTSGNKVTLELFGLTEKELQQKHLFDYASKDNIENIKQEFARVLKGESVTGESSYQTADGQNRHFSFTEIPIVVNGQIVGVYGIAKDVTVSKKQQLLLEATAKRMNNILESIKDAFFTIDKDWKFTYVNKEFENVMGISRNSLLGFDFREVFPEHDFSSGYGQFQNTLAQQMPVHYETFYQPAELWVDISAYPSEEGISVYFREINHRKKVEAELKKLSLVASKTVNSVYITDENARIEWVNEGFTRITGYTLDEVIGCRPGDFLAGPATSTEKVSSIRQKLTLDKPFVQEVQNRNRAGEVYWSKLDVTPIIDENDGGGKKFIVIETVITDQKKAEEERAQLTEELLRRNRHLEQFTYIVSHNLRSPVANILGLTSLLNTAQAPEMQKALTERLQKTAQNLDTIIRDLNDLLSLRADVIEQRETVSLPEVVDQALQVLPTDSSRHVVVQLNGITHIGSVRSYLSSILSNLITNAVKYRSPDRELEIMVQAEWGQEGKMLCLSVKDNGLGINLAKEGKNLFGLYKRFHFHVAGRGLGLYLVKTQAEALGGHVSVESEPGVGSTFNICLPREI